MKIDSSFTGKQGKVHAPILLSASIVFIRFRRLPGFAKYPIHVIFCPEQRDHFIPCRVVALIEFFLFGGEGRVLLFEYIHGRQLSQPESVKVLFRRPVGYDFGLVSGVKLFTPTAVAVLRIDIPRLGISSDMLLQSGNLTEPGIWPEVKLSQTEIPPLCPHGRYSV